MAQTEMEILQSLVPEATIENITFESNRTGDEQGILLRIVYSISDVVEQDAIGTWFNQIEYEKYFLVTTILREDSLFPQLSAERPVLTNTTLGELIEEADNSRVKKFTFEKTFLLGKEPENLTFEIETKFNVGQMERDFDIDLFDLTKLSAVKKNEIVILENSKLKYPVQDFRIREELKRFELSEEQQQVFQFLAREVSAKKKFDMEMSKDFLSDMWITRNAQGEAKFVFIFDAVSFFEKNSEYREIYKRLSPLEKYELIRQIQIPSLKVMRKRVKVVSDKNGRSVIDFPDKYSLEEIVETRKIASNNFFDKVVTETGSIMQINITGVSQSRLNDNNLLFITGTDYSIADITDGTYSYGISFDVVDTTRQVLLRKLKALSDRVFIMKEILSMSLIPKFYNARTNLYTMPLEDIIGDDVKKERFRTAKNRVIDVYKTFMGNISNKNLPTINRFFRMDTIKSPKELEMIIEIMETLLANAASVVGESSDYYTGKKSASASDIRISTEKFYTSPDKIFDSNIPKMEGMEYLSNFAEKAPEEVMREISSLSRDSGDVGIRVIDGAEYEGRVDNEVNKFFPAGTKQVTVPALDDDIPGANKVSLTSSGSEFLTVSAAINPVADPLVFSGKNDAVSSRAIINNDIIRNMERHLPGVPVLPSIDERKEASYLAKQGVSFGNSESEKTLLNDDSGRTDSTSRTRNLPDRTIEVLERQSRLRASDDFVAQKNFEEFVFDKVSKEIKTSIRRSAIVSAANLQAPVPGSAYSNLTPVKKREVIEQAPNQVVSSSTSSEGDIEESALVVSSEFLTRVSFLSGFEQAEGRENVSLPKWESLTLDAYKNNTDKNLLCRIKPYHMEELGIRATNSRTPIYDAFFIIKPVGNFVYEYIDGYEAPLLDNMNVDEGPGADILSRQSLFESNRRQQDLLRLIEERDARLGQQEELYATSIELQEELEALRRLPWNSAKGEMMNDIWDEIKRLNGVILSLEPKIQELNRAIDELST